MTQNEEKANWVCCLHSQNAKFQSIELQETDAITEIGRKPNFKPSCKFEDTRLSTLHCKVFLNETDGDFRITVEDCSTNGTFVNDTKIGKGNQQILSNDDVVSLVAPSIHHKLAKELPVYRVEVRQKLPEVQPTLLVLDQTMVLDHDMQQEEEDDVVSVTEAEVKSAEERISAYIQKVSAESSNDKKRKRDEDDSEEAETASKLQKTDKADKSAGKKVLDEKTRKILDMFGAADLEDSQDEDPVGKELTCGICAETFYKPLSTLPCLHNFCGACLSGWLRNNTTCPQCRASVTEVRKNHIISNLVESFLKSRPSKQRGEEETKTLDEQDYISKQIAKTGEWKVGAISIDDEDDEDEDFDDEEDNSSDEDDNVRCPECRAPSAVDGHQCSAGDSHATCSACSGLVPERTVPDRPVRCRYCLTVVCSPYFTSCPSGRSLKKLEQHQIQILPLTCLNNNQVERQILLDYLGAYNMNVNTMWQQICGSIRAGNYTFSMHAVTVTGDDLCCDGCAEQVFEHFIYRYREDIDPAKLPQWVTSRVNCWYGKECRTQAHNRDHARKLNHICDNARRT